MIQQQLKKFLPVLATIAFVSVLFFPSTSLSESLPRIEFIDFLLPFIAVYVFLRRKEIVQRNAIFILIGFSAYVLITIGINGRLTNMRDYFEIFKLLKIVIILGLFSLSGAIELMKKIVKPIFVGLVVLNLIHYFNLFQINEFLDQLFMGGGRYSIFGLDSSGHPTFKRMIGLVGNPNDNAIVFMIFSIFFFPRKAGPPKSYGWFLVALIMMFLCQSRTALITLFPMLLIFAIIYWKESRRLVLSTIAVSGIAFLLAFGITKTTVNVGFPSKYAVLTDSEDSTYVEPETSYFEAVVTGDITQSQSIKGRIETWKHLWGMIKKKPIFGHAPYKEYFYESKIYAESEYFLIIWRYGFLGLTIYLFFLLALFRHSLKHRHKEYGFKLLMLLVVFLVTGLTNVPFGNKTILVLLGIMIGLFYNEISNSKTEEQAEDSQLATDE